MKKQKHTPLYTALTNHINSNPISFHVPGHKNGMLFPQGGNKIYKNVLSIDQTEISGLDDLHSPEGVIQEAQNLLANMYSVKSSYFLVNGSTSGNLAMILSVCQPGDQILVQRNCHKSILNGLMLAKARPIFLAAEYDVEWQVAGGVSVNIVKEALVLYPEVKGLILTYPNYYGLTYPLKDIIEIAHKQSIPVLVDEAHGAHFIIGEPFPPSAITLGADIVVQSAHKTLPAMTMGSFLHFNSKLISEEALKHFLQMVQSSSPSYPIMASLDLARQFLAQYDKDDIDFLYKSLLFFRDELNKIQGIRVLTNDKHAIDPLKITIRSTNGLTGYELQQQLEREGIYSELADPCNVLLVFPLLKVNNEFPWKESLEKVRTVMKIIETKESKEYQSVLIHDSITEGNFMDLNLFHHSKYEVPIEEAEGKLSGESVIPYPPGIPILLPGEQITSNHIKTIKNLLLIKARFQGGDKLLNGKLVVFNIE